MLWRHQVAWQPPSNMLTRPYLSIYAQNTFCVRLNKRASIFKRKKEKKSNIYWFERNSLSLWLLINYFEFWKYKLGTQLDALFHNLCIQTVHNLKYCIGQMYLQIQVKAIKMLIAVVQLRYKMRNSKYKIYRTDFKWWFLTLNIKILNYIWNNKIFVYKMYK